MALTRRTRIGLWLGGAAAVVALLLWLLPMGMRWGAVHWLEERGLDARIADMDFNPFTGRLAVTDARAEHPDGDGFDIGSLALNLRYLPLFSGQIYLSELRVGTGHVDVVRTGNADGIRVGGLSLMGGDGSDAADSGDDDGAAWGFGLDRAGAEALTLRYSAPDFERKVTLSSSNAADVATWRPEQPIPLDAEANVGEAHVRLEGTLQPFGDRLAGDLALSLENFNLGVVAPLAEDAGVTRLAGTVSAKLDITLDYRADAGLTMDSDGTVALAGTELTIPQVAIDGGDLDWEGSLHAELLRTAADEPALFRTDGTLTLDGGDLTVPDTLRLTQGSARWQGRAETRLTAEGARIDAEGSLDGQGLDAQVPAVELGLTVSELAWEGTSRYGADSLDNEGQLTLNGAALSVPAASLDVAGESVSWDGQTGFRVGGGENGRDDKPPFRASGALDGGGIAVTDTRIGRTLARAESLTVEAVQAEGAALEADRIAADELRALARADGAPRMENHPYVLDLAQLVLTAPAWNGGDRITVERAQAAGLNALLLRDANGNWEVVDWAPPGDDADDGETTLTVAVGAIELGEGSALNFDDRAINPPFATRLSGLTASVRDLDSGAPDSPATFELSADVGRYGDLRSEGQACAFGDAPSFEIDSEIDALNLANLSGYVVQAVNRSVSQGTLSAKARVNADEGQLDGTIDLILNQFRLGPSPAGPDAAEDQLGLPLDQAMALMRDGDGGINFSLPLSGNVANPQFSYVKVVQKAILKGVQTAILGYYSPLGVIATAGELINLGDALKFKPVPFAPGQSTLRDAGRDYLDQAAEVLGKRPDAKFVVCGHAVPADRSAMGLPPAREADDGEARDALLALARERTTAVSNYLLRTGIANNRLVPCTPEMGEGEDAAPRATLSF